jgi:transcription initiation factor TFIID subunit 9B
MAGYTSDILTDSLMYAEHARAGSTSTAPIVPSVDDVRLAVQARTEGAQLPKEVRIVSIRMRDCTVI